MSVRVIHGDCRAVLPTLADQSMQCCVTSPPYWGLRDYGVEGQIGQEASADDYVKSLVIIFRDVRRVLKNDGCVFLNIGDSYGRGSSATEQNKQRLMIPARVALALQADGWWLRDEIVWHKPRTTPFPLKDRTVPAHEMVYLLARSKRYFFDYEAISEVAAYPGVVRKAGKAFRDLEASDPRAAQKRPGADREIAVGDMRLARSVWSISPSPYKDGHFATMPPALAERCILAGSRPGDTILDPFSGAGTTALVADRLQRDAIGIELNPEYAAMGAGRVRDDAPLFA